MANRLSSTFLCPPPAHRDLYGGGGQLDPGAPPSPRDEGGGGGIGPAVVGGNRIRADKCIRGPTVRGAVSVTRESDRLSVQFPETESEMGLRRE